MPSQTNIQIQPGSSKNFRVYFFLFFFIAAGFTFFGIHKYPVQMWDESRNAVNAQEMFENGDFVVRYCEGDPDFWETKPPLLIWCITTSYYLFGINEFALRFPTSLALLLTSLFWTFWLFKRTKNQMIAFGGGIGILTTIGLNTWHTGFTGDHDTLLCFFLSLATAFWFEYIHGQTKGFGFLTFIAILLACLTKSVMGLMFLPGFGFFLIWSKNRWSLLKKIEIWLGFLTLIVVLASYYLVHEARTPGYLNAIWDNELFPRFANTSNKFTYEKPSFWELFIQLFQNRFQFWIYLIILAYALLIVKRNKEFSYEKKYFQFLVGVSFIFLTIISIGSHNIWYDAPGLTLLAASLGFAFFFIASQLKHKLFKRIFISVFILRIFFNGANIIHEKINLYNTTDNSLKYGPFMKELKALHPEIRSYKIPHRGYNLALVFYSNKLNLENQFYTRRVNLDEAKIWSQDTIVTGSEEIIKELEMKWKLDVIYRTQNGMAAILGALSDTSNIIVSDKLN